MADPTWAARPPELNDTLIKGGVGVPTMVANGAAWASVAAAHHSTAVASSVNTAATSATWLGMGSASSAVQATTLNVELHGLAGWVDVKPAIAEAAVSAYQLAYSSMRTAEECLANRTEWGNDNAINPLVFFALTPRITSLDLTYFGGYWPNNAAVGATYGATLTTLAASLAIPPPIASMGASPAAPAAAAEAVAEAGGQTAASGAMKSSFQAVNEASQSTQQGTSGAADMGGQLSSMLGPVQEIGSQVMQLPQQAMQVPQQAMQPLQSVMGMFANPSMFGGASPAASALSSTAAPAGGVPAGALSSGVSGGGGGATGGGGAPASSFTRPVSAFEPGGGGRAVGLRPAGVLNASEAGPHPVTTTGGGGMGGMPVGHGAGGARGGQSEKESARTASVSFADQRV